MGLLKKILDQGLQKALKPNCGKTLLLVTNRIQELNLKCSRATVAFGVTNWFKFVVVQKAGRVDNTKFLKKNEVVKRLGTTASKHQNFKHFATSEHGTLLFIKDWFGRQYKIFEMMARLHLNTFGLGDNMSCLKYGTIILQNVWFGRQY